MKKITKYVSIECICFLIFISGCSNDSMEIAQRQERANIPANQEVASNPSRLWKAAADGDIDTVSRFCQQKTLLNSQDAQGNTALMFAAQAGHTQVVKTLLENGANPNACNRINATALLYAAQNGHVYVVNLLINAGANVNIADKQGGSTALHKAAYLGQAEVADALLAKRAAVDAKNDYGRTPLMLAAGKGYIRIVKALLANRADPSLLDNYGKSALDYARENNAADCVSILQSAMNGTSKDTRNPVYHASLGVNGTANFTNQLATTRTGEIADTNINRDSNRDVEAINDIARIKLLMLGLGVKDRLGGLQLQHDGTIAGKQPPWASEVVDSMSKELESLLHKYDIDLRTSKIDSIGSSIGSSDDQDGIHWWVIMDEWSDIVTIMPPSTKLPEVKLKSGTLTLKLPSLEVVFENGAVCSVSGKKYVYRDSRWTAIE